MKYRESGMPAEELWSSFFEPAEVLRLMNVNRDIRTFVDIGSGYGTFLFPSAALVANHAIGIDIDEEMVNLCRAKTKELELSNVVIVHGDISTEKTLKTIDQYRSEIDYVSLFNILHCEDPVFLLKSTHNILSPHGKVGIIHWKREDTPRGPSMSIRPTPDMVIEWAGIAGFTLQKQLDLPPYHYGLVFTKQ